MTSAASPTSGNIFLNFAWMGPNTIDVDGTPINVSILELLFGSKSSYSVDLPNTINTVNPKSISFTRRTYSNTEGKHESTCTIKEETHPDSLSITIERVRNLQIKAGFLQMAPKCVVNPKTNKISTQISFEFAVKPVTLTIPEDLEIGQTYRLLVESDGHFPLKARLIKQ